MGELPFVSSHAQRGPGGRLRNHEAAAQERPHVGQRQGLQENDSSPSRSRVQPPSISTESEESVEFLLRQNDILVNCTDEFGNTPLHIAFVREHLGTLELFRVGEEAGGEQGRPLNRERRPFGAR